MKLYLILFLIISQFTFAQAQWKCHVVDNKGTGADGIKFNDINNDGKSDIVTGWEESKITKVYLQPYISKIKEQWPAITVGCTPAVEDALFLDVNNDGFKDVISLTENLSQKIYAHINPGPDNIMSGEWKQKVIPASDGLMSWMYAIPMQVDNKNNVDLLAAGKGKNAALGWFEAPVSNDLNDWSWHDICKVGWIMSIIKFDMDADGDLDVIITDRRGELAGCRWLENPGTDKVKITKWKNHFIGAKNKEVMFMSIDTSNGITLYVCERSNNTIRVYSETGKAWNEKIIPIPVNTGMAKSIECGDINGDGVNDLVLSTNTLKEIKNGLIWLDGTKAEKPKENDWKVISGKHIAKYDKVELIDLDNDGDLDVLICEENCGKNSEGLGVVWYENPHN